VTDIATLGIAVDASDLDDGVRALDRMGDQAALTGRQVQASAAAMSRSFAQTSRSAGIFSR